jgi:nucleoside-triphosphatase THEP1
MPIGKASGISRRVYWSKPPIGRMELASQRFTARLDDVFAQPRPVVATVHLACARKVADRR